MKKLTTIWLLIIVSATMALAQTSDEKEVLKFIADYDQAYLNKDVAFAERVWADNYVLSTDIAKKENRAQSLEGARKDKADPNPKYKLLSFKSVNDSMHIAGNTAIVSGSWTSSVVPTEDLKSEPHIDTGRYTMALEKRSGKWVIVAEHYSETPHDKKAMEAQVLKMGQEYTKMIRNQDATAIERILFDEYLYTNEKGKVKNKAEDLASYKNSDTKFEVFEISDQKVRVISNNAAVETGTIRFKGSARGKPFDGSERYTTTWISRNGQWKIVADHTSTIAESK